ncbi:MAG: VOC family protein [Parasphingorhabdus sp.]|uniref:VOC family protein n=1 Tax=Parasphingorhabdus sp. TaxID=2709688 RepID=UPI0032969136
MLMLKAMAADLLKFAALFSASLGLCGIGLVVPAHAQKIEPWSEAIVSVRDLDKASRLFIDYGEWRIISEDNWGKSQQKYWKLADSMNGRYRLICAPHADTGCIRFIRIDGAKNQKPIRPAARPWDTGGIFSLMIRSNNVDALYEKALAMGWWAESAPYRFQFGTSDLNNVVLQGPHGMNLAVYQRISPAFTNFPVGNMSQVFNSMRMVRDQKATLRFYREKLGFQLLFDADYLDPKPTTSNFSLPINLTTSIVRRAAVVQPVSGETGRIELMQFVGLNGRDFSDQASLPRLGIISVRYPVNNLATYRIQLESRDVKIEHEAKNMPLEGVGNVNLIAVRDRDGNLTEFFEKTPAAK